MKTTVPYTKNIMFKTDIAEITSISLENTLNKDDEELTGEFIISGEYKAHELSVNKETFNYKLPFSVDLTENIDKESIKFEILDFYYDIINKDTLKVNIEFSVEAEEKEIPQEESEPIFEEPEEKYVTTLEEMLSATENVRNDLEVEDTKAIPIETPKAERIDVEEENTIIEEVKKSEETYITYKIHIFREQDNLETICKNYSTNLDIIKQYNNLEEISIGDKILIPIENE